MKRVLSLVLVVIVVAAAVWGYLYAQSRGSAPKYRTARVERGPLTSAVSATGNLNAVITVQVGSQVSGQVAELMADFNSVVKKNQIVARIDPALFEAKVNQAKADVDSAQANVLNQQAQVERARADVENARAALAEAKANTAKSQVTLVDSRRDFDRKTELFRRDLIAKSDLDSSQATHDSSAAVLDASRAKEQSLVAAIGSADAQLKVAQAMLESARAQVKQKKAALDQAQIDLDHTTIRAPVDGVVVSRAVDVGQTVAASLAAPTLFTIAQDLTKMQVETSVDEADIGKIRLDAPVTFTVDAFSGRTFTGEVTQIRKAALVVQNVVTYTVVVGVGNPEGKLLPGMTANVKLVVSEKPNVLKVSNAALRFRPPGADAGPSGPSGGATARGGQSLGGGAPAEGRGEGGREGGRRPSLEEIRERLVKQLALTPPQQAKLEPILQESRQQMMGLRELPEGERRAKAQKIREASRVQIRALLTPEQQAKYDEMTPAPAQAGGEVATPGRVYVLDAEGKPKAVNVTLGISDGSSTEVVRGELKEGQEIVAGLSGGGKPGTPGGPKLKL
ncbi:MAG TPA: efflux RND transporter periplasmic adaptor subunit [Candidatus Acidoferrum sp.]|nr:efflux RND transporter periplasmic adaptor subunit [Candidatus Acidoferrum sp.]